MSEEGSSSAEESTRKGSRLEESTRKGSRLEERKGLRFEAVREEGRRGNGEKEGRCSSPIMSECTAAMVIIITFTIEKNAKYLVKFRGIPQKKLRNTNKKRNFVGVLHMFLEASSVK